MRRSPILVLVFLAVSCATVPPSTVEPVHVVIVGTTDVHGWFNGRVETPPGGGAGVAHGGLPAFSSYVEALRAQHGGRVVVVDSGDMFQGTLESNLFEGEAMVNGYNDIGYAAAAVGNHEFDFGPVGPDAVAREAGQDPLGALKRNAGIAHFPLLSANMVEKDSGRTPSWARRYTMVETGGVRIGIIGLSTPDTPNVTMSLNVQGLKFVDPIPSTIAAAAELRGRGADAVIVIAHMGGRCTETDDPRSPESCEPDHEAMDLLQRLPAGTIDGLFAGHTHSRMRHYIHGVPAMQALAYGREFSTMDLWIDPRGNKVVRSELRPHTMICTMVYEGTDRCDPATAPKGAALVPRVFAGRTIRPDARLVTTLEPYNYRVAARRDARVGIQVVDTFRRSHSRESSLGTLIADAMREYSQTDFAFMNPGGIRSDLGPGDLTYGDVFAVSPFDNYPAVVTMTGAEIREVLRILAATGRGLFQVSGLRYGVDHAKDAARPADERDPIVSLTKADGTPLDPNALYTVAMPDFIAAGGDGTAPVFSKIPQNRIAVSYLKPIRDALVDVLSRRPQPLRTFTDGRITVLNAPGM